MKYISLDEAAAITGQKKTAIQRIVRLIEDGHFPASVLKRFYVEGSWKLYIDRSFITSQYITTSLQSKASSRNDSILVATILAFAAMFALILYIGNGIISTSKDNARLEAANALQRKALDEAYGLIEQNRQKKEALFKPTDTQALTTQKREIETPHDTEIIFDSIAPEKVAIE